MRTLVLLALATALVSTAAGAANNFEDITAPSGTIPTGNGPIWQAPDAAVLYNNGPLVTNIGTCPGNPPTNESQIRPGGSTFGYGHQLSVPNRVADDFTVPAGQQWEIQAITFFAYQSGAGSGAPTINQVDLKLWNGRPGDAGAQVICSSTNALALSVFSGIYRTVNTAPCPGATTRAIFSDICTLPAGCPPCLPAGHYWLDWSTGGSAAFSGPWAPPVTPRPATANGRQFVTPPGAWQDLADAADLLIEDLPFIIDGVECGATPVENSTWGAIKGQWK